MEGDTRVPKSNITKKVLAAAFKELVCKHSFEKVNVSSICDACGVNRKTFYYHFQDKYELAEWIFNTEFIAVLKKTDISDQWAFASAICQYFYRERTYYAGLVQYNGQNSFGKYFQAFMFEALEPFLLPKSTAVTVVAGQARMSEDEAASFYCHFFTDAVLISIFRWITDGAAMPPDQFISRLRSVADILLIRAKEVAADN